MFKSKNCKEFFCNRSAKHCTRRRRERRAQARHRAVGWQLHQESLESRIALSINSYTTQGGEDLYTGEYRAGTFDGAVVIASDRADNVYLQQVATISDPARGNPTSQDLLVANNSSFLDYKVIDGVDTTTNGFVNYRHIFVTNGTEREEGVADVLRPDFYYGGPDKNGDRPFTTRFLINTESVGWITTILGDVYVGAGGTISYTQTDGVVTSWMWFASSSLGAVDTYAGLQFTPTNTPGTPPFPAGASWISKPEYIQPNDATWNSMYPGSPTDNQQAWLDVTWSDITDPYAAPALVMNLESPGAAIVLGTPPDLDGNNDPLGTFFPAQGFGTWQAFDNSVIPSMDDPPSFSFATLKFALPGAFASTADGTINERSLGVIPATLSGPAGSINITWSDGIPYPLSGFEVTGDIGRKVGFRSDSRGILRFDTAVAGRFTDSMAFIVTGGMGVISVSGLVQPSGIITLTFRRWDAVIFVPGGGIAGLPPKFNFAIQRAIQGVPGPVTIAAVDRYSASGVVKEPIRYATYTLDARHNDVTFFAGQTITRQVTVDLLAPGSTVFVDSPIIVGDFLNASNVPPQKKGSLDFRATNINVRATMTAPYRLMVGRSDNPNRDRLTILPPYDAYSDYDNPWQIAPDMGHLYTEVGGIPVPRTSQLQAVVVSGAVSKLIPMPGFIGYGYDPDSPPTVTIEAPGVGGVQATAIAVVGSNGNIVGFNIIQSGSGYTIPRPAVTVSAALARDQSLAEVADINAATGGVTSIAVLDPGYGYLTPPVVEVESPPAGLDNVRAIAQAVLDPEGRVIAIEIVDPGRGYVSRPVVTLAAPAQFALTELLKVDARIEANNFELYVNDDFGTQDTHRGTVSIAANAALSTTPFSVTIILASPALPGATKQTLTLAFPSGLAPPNFNPVGALITGLGFTADTRVLSWDRLNNQIEVQAGFYSESVFPPTAARIMVRADSLYLEAVTTDIFATGLFNVDNQTYLLQSRAVDRVLSPFVFTTASPVTGTHTGTIEGGVVSITLGNNAATPFEGSTAYQVADLQTRILSLRVRAAVSNVDSAAAFPYDLSISDLGANISIDALVASSRPISLKSFGNMTMTSAVTTDSDLTIDARSPGDTTLTSFTVTSPVISRYGAITISADRIEVRNSLAVSAAAVQPSRDDVFLQARRGDLVLQGAITAVNDVTLEQYKLTDAIKGVIDGGTSRVQAEQVIVRSEGSVTLRTDATTLRGQAVTGFVLSELNDIAIPLLSSGGLVKLEALGVDPGSRGANSIALSANLLDVINLVVNTPNGTCRIDANTAKDLLLGDANAIKSNGSREVSMRAAGDVTIRSQAGNIVALDLPIAGAGSRSVRVATTTPLPAATAYDPGTTGSIPSKLSGVGSINKFTTPAGNPFWGRDDRLQPISLIVGDRVLVKDQLFARENGVYVVTKVGGGVLGSVRWELSRAADSDMTAEMLPGTMVRVADGSYYDQIFVVNYSAVPQTLVQRTAANEIQLPETFSYFHLIQVGQLVTGAGIAPNAYVSSIDPQSGLVTLDVVKPGQVYAQQALPSVDVTPYMTLNSILDPDTLLLAPDFTSYADLTIGQAVTGAGIRIGAKITHINALNQTISVTPESLPDAIGPVVVAPAVSGSVLTDTITLPLISPQDLERVRVGQRVILFNIVNAVVGVATVKSVSMTLSTVTLSGTLPLKALPVTAWFMPVPTIQFGPPPATAVQWVIAKPNALELGPLFTNYDGLAIGQSVMGAGISAGTVITVIDRAKQKIKVSPGALPIKFGPLDVDRPTRTSFGLPVDFTLSSIHVGQIVDLLDGSGNTIGSVGVSGVNFQTRTVNLAQALPAGAIAVQARFRAVESVLFGVGGPGSVPVDWNSWAARNNTVGKPNDIALPNFTDFAGLTIGQSVYGLEIPQGTRISSQPNSINAAQRTITVTVDNLKTPVTWSRATPNVITLPVDFNRYQDLALGRRVYGPGVLPGAVIVELNPNPDIRMLKIGPDPSIQYLPLAMEPAPFTVISADTLSVGAGGGFKLADVHIGQRAVVQDGLAVLGEVVVTGTDLVNFTVTFDSGLPAGIGATTAKIEFLPLNDVNLVQIEVDILPNTISTVHFGAGSTALHPAANTLVLPTNFVLYSSLFVGQGVFGEGIQPGAVITSIDVPNRLITVTPQAIAPAHDLLGVAVADSEVSPWYPAGFDDWVELDSTFNQFTDIHVGQRVEFFNVTNSRLGVGVVTGVDGAYRTVGFNDGALGQFASTVTKVSFLSVSSVRFGVIDGVGATYVDFALPAIGRMPIMLAEKSVTTNIGSDAIAKTVTFVVSTNGATNVATGSLGKMILGYQRNDTTETLVDVPVIDVSLLTDGSAVLEFNSLFTAYDRILVGQWVNGTPRMFTASAKIQAVDAAMNTITLVPGSLTELAIDNLNLIAYATIPATTLNPNQLQSLKFWAYGNESIIRLTQELPNITTPTSIDGSGITTAGGVAGWIPTYTGNVVIDGQRITRNRRDRLATLADRLNGFLITNALDANGGILSSADGTKITKLTIGGFPRGEAVRLEGVSNVVLDTLWVGSTRSHERLPNYSSIHVTSAFKADGSILMQAKENAVINCTVVSGLSTGIAIDGGAERTYVVGTTVGTPQVENQTGIFIDAKSNFIGVNNIPPATQLTSQTRLTAGSIEIKLSPGLFGYPLIGLGVAATGLPIGTVITGSDSSLGLAYLSNAALVSRSTTVTIGHLAVRISPDTDDASALNVVYLYPSVPLDDVFVGQGLTGDGIAAGTVIAAIDRVNLKVTLSKEFTAAGTGFVSFAAPGRNTVQYNRTGIVLRGNKNRVTNTTIANNTLDGIDVATAGNTIGSQSYFGKKVDAPGKLAVTSWGISISAAAGAQKLSLPSTFTGSNSIAVGTQVYGPGVAPGTLITAITPPTSRVNTWTLGLSSPLQTTVSNATMSFAAIGANNQPLRLALAPSDIKRLFVGQGVHGAGMPEFSKIEAISVPDGKNGYVRISQPSTLNLVAQNFTKVVSPDLVFSLLSTTSNEIWGNGNYGIRVRHDYVYRGTTITRNYLGLTSGGQVISSNRLGDVHFAQYSAVPGQPRMPPEHRPNPTEQIDGFGNKYGGTTGQPTGPGGPGGTGPLPPWPRHRDPKP